MQSDNCKEFYKAAFNLLETIVVCIELSAKNLFVGKIATMTRKTDVVLGGDLPSLGQEPWIHDSVLRDCLGSQCRWPRDTCQPFELDVESVSAVPA